MATHWHDGSKNAAFYDPRIPGFCLWIARKRNKARLSRNVRGIITCERTCEEAAYCTLMVSGGWKGKTRLPKQNMSFLIKKINLLLLLPLHFISSLFYTLSFILFCFPFLFHYILFSSAVLFFSLPSAILLLHSYFSLLLVDLSHLSLPPPLNLFASL